MASPDHIILYYCGLQKKEEKNLYPFNLESITVHLVMLFDFLVYETKFTVGKWQMVVFTAGKKERSMGGGNSTLGGIPQAVPD